MSLYAKGMKIMHTNFRFRQLWPCHQFLTSLNNSLCTYNLPNVVASWQQKPVLCKNICNRTAETNMNGFETMALVVIGSWMYWRISHQWIRKIWNQHSITIMEWIEKIRTMKTYYLYHYHTLISWYLVLYQSSEWE